jgi:hypothetical protein
VLSSTRSRRRSNSPLDRETAVFVLREPVSQQHHARPIRSRLHPPSFNSSEIKGHIERTAGEIGMLTGQPAEATLKALVQVTTYELAKEDLAPVLEARPDVSHELCRALAKRQAAGQLIAAAGIDKSAPPRRVAAWFSDRLHRIFDLANAE